MSECSCNFQSLAPEPAHTHLDWRITDIFIAHWYYTDMLMLQPPIKHLNMFWHMSIFVWRCPFSVADMRSSVPLCIPVSVFVYIELWLAALSLSSSSAIKESVIYTLVCVCHYSHHCPSYCGKSRKVEKQETKYIFNIIFWMVHMCVFILEA